MRIRIATRKSALALAQTRMIARDLSVRSPGLEIEEVQIVTEGDRVQDRSLAEIGGKGLFIKELERALLDGRADLAVHSMKDLPAELAPGLVIASVPPRESPWDLLVTRDGRTIGELPMGACVGTSSLRRQIQLRAVRGDLRIELLRGNVDTRLRRLEDGHFDAVILAEAGVRRLGLKVRATRLEGSLVPSIGQGALALETRADDAATMALVRTLDDADSHLATDVERTVMRALGGSCTTPIGALAQCIGDRIEAFGFYATPDGARHARAQASGALDAPLAVGEALAQLLRRGIDGAG